MKRKRKAPFTDLFSRRYELKLFEVAGFLARLTFWAFPSVS